MGRDAREHEGKAKPGRDDRFCKRYEFLRSVIYDFVAPTSGKEGIGSSDSVIACSHIPPGRPVVQSVGPATSLYTHSACVVSHNAVQVRSSAVSDSHSEVDGCGTRETIILCGRDLPLRDRFEDLDCVCWSVALLHNPLLACPAFQKIFHNAPVRRSPQACQ
ncbi:hypothetical protein BV20DRAFT_552148 [Pilatotrama ljubarskyi]|nr:hypothetical protein BV20DRAFT_552148 [Pilatotrama ljubarskyi]